MTEKEDDEHGESKPKCTFSVYKTKDAKTLCKTSREEQRWVITFCGLVSLTNTFHIIHLIQCYYTYTTDVSNFNDFFQQHRRRTL